MPTNAELQAENDSLHAELEQLREDAQAVVADSAEEVAALREQLAAARANAKATPNVRPKPAEPSFGISEGQRAELEQTGKTVSPFTGARQVGSGAPGARPKTVDAQTYDKTPAKNAG
jgi:hypothetical protein